MRNAIAVLILVFAAISIFSEYRGRKSEDRYGRLYERTMPAEQVKAETPMPIVEEKEPVADQNGADPMLTRAAARGQWLLEEKSVPVPVARPQAPVAAPRPSARPGDVEIVGGRQGVAVVAPESHPKPALSGGIFKPQYAPALQQQSCWRRLRTQGYRRTLRDRVTKPSIASTKMRRTCPTTSSLAPTAGVP